jgi:hypothetical protein
MVLVFVIEPVAAFNPKKNGRLTQNKTQMANRVEP